MSPFAEFPLLSVFVLLVLGLVLIAVLSPKRPPRLPPMQRGGEVPGGPGRRSCMVCNAEHPTYATYCRRCGNRL